MAIIIGGIGGLVVYYGTRLLIRLKIDDVVGAIPVHGFAGIWGTLVVPLTNSMLILVLRFMEFLDQYFCFRCCIYYLVFNENKFWNKNK